MCFPPKTRSSLHVRRPFGTHDRTFVRGGNINGHIPIAIDRQQHSSLILPPVNCELRSKTTRIMSTTTDETSVVDAVDEATSRAQMKLSSLRRIMNDRDVDVYLIPSDDPHLSGKVCCSLLR
jgi:hypothetical protein